MSFSLSRSFALSCLSLASLASFAQTAEPEKAPEPDSTLSFNLGAVTDYRYRGISQSAKGPAVQGGVDFGLKSGLYVGAWASNINWIKDSGPGVKGPVETDWYAGFKNAINDTFSYDVGGLQYLYIGNNLSKIEANANTFELYGALSAGPATLKYSRSLTNLFGTPSSSGSGYLDLSASFDLGNGFSVAPHVGRQSIHNFGNYTDYSLALNKDFDGLVLSATVIGTNWKNKFGTAYMLPGSGSKDLAGTTLVVGLKKTF